MLDCNSEHIGHIWRKMALSEKKKKNDVWLLSIINRSKHRYCSSRALLFLNYHLIQVPCFNNVTKPLWIKGSYSEMRNFMPKFGKDNTFLICNPLSPRISGGPKDRSWPAGLRLISGPLETFPGPTMWRWEDSVRRILTPLWEKGSRWSV